MKNPLLSLAFRIRQLRYKGQWRDAYGRLCYEAYAVWHDARHYIRNTSADRKMRGKTNREGNENRSWRKRFPQTA